MSKPQWIIDTDAGVDDCQALALALTSPEIEVLAITTVAGNVNLQQVIKNTAETLKISGKNVPFFVGAERPLVSQLVSAEGIHGADGLNNYWENRETEDLPRPGEMNAVQAIIELSKIHQGNINIVTIGPLTNLALAVAIDPLLPSRFNRVVVMGAAVHGKGNRTIVAEFNVWADPEAAFITFERFPLLEIVSWETCTEPDHQFDISFLHEYKQGTTPIGKFIGEITKVHEGRSTVFFCDPITLAICIDPSIVLKETLKYGVVELSGALTRGMTVVNWKRSDEKEINMTPRKNLKIAEKLDMEKIRALFLRSIH
jgi:purine nucleosidase